MIVSDVNDNGNGEYKMKFNHSDVICAIKDAIKETEKSKIYEKLYCSHPKLFPSSNPRALVLMNQILTARQDIEVLQKQFLELMYKESLS